MFKLVWGLTLTFCLLWRLRDRVVQCLLQSWVSFSPQLHPLLRQTWKNTLTLKPKLCGYSVGFLLCHVLHWQVSSCCRPCVSAPVCASLQSCPDKPKDWPADWSPPERPPGGSPLYWTQCMTTEGRHKDTESFSDTATEKVQSQPAEWWCQTHFHPRHR